ELELHLFTDRGRQVVPIVFVGGPAAPWRSSIDGLDHAQYRALAYISDSQLHIQDDHANLARGPSDAVIQQLTDTQRVMRRRTGRALAVGLVMAALVAFSAFSTGSWARAYLAQLNAESSAQTESNERVQEEKARKLAEERARIATSRQLAALSALERN